ncbi:MAG TPA: ROK family protein [Aeromicrobium sp.]|nr:ROK family protein [Aeromicrobium sp.]
MSVEVPAVGVDIGGTKIAVGTVATDGRVLEEVSAPTPDDTATIPALIADLIARVTPSGGVAAVGIGAAGFISSDRSTVRFSPNIAWADEPLGAAVQQLVGVPVVVENDANAAAWGEFRFGSGTDVDDLLLVTIGTGVGGGLVQRGAVVRGASGTATEIGHMRLVPDGLPCGCGQRGCFEQYVSGSALVRAGRERLGSETVSGPQITRLAQDGDEAAVELLAELGARAGEGIASLAAILDPAVVLIGGGVSDAGELLMTPLKHAFSAHLSGAAHRPTIDVRPAALGNSAGLVGAADLSRIGG